MHKHHKIPRHAGGTNNPENIELLTVEEHAEAHRILWEKYGKWQDFLAWRGLLGCINKEDILKEIAAKTNSGNKYWLGKKHTPESKEKIRKSKLGKTPWNKGKKGCQVGWNKGLTIDDPRVAKCAKARTGKGSSLKGKKIGQYSPERRKAISEGIRRSKSRKLQ